VSHGQGQIVDLGIAKMRLLAAADQTGKTFGLAEFTGKEGAWTVPHVHRQLEESFFIIDGRFTFTIADETVEAGPGDYLLVSAMTPHVFEAQSGGGTILVLWVPGGLEQMFIELSQLSPDALRDPKTRAEVASRHDSIPL
jgi:mannose-6-phosphate isomerase-like protein (cupin superfamily)